MPMFTTFFTGLPVWPVHAPERTRSPKSAILRNTRVHLRHDVLAVDLDDRALGQRAARRAGRRGPSVTLIFSPRNIASIRSRRPARCASSRRSRTVSSVMRFFE